MDKKSDFDIAAIPRIAQSIVVLRQQRVMLDSDLAALYGVTTKRLNEQVKRNASRFPADFLFQLTAEENAGLRSQIATSNVIRGGRRHAPYAFTEHGAIMAAAVLNSTRAVEMSIYVVRAFVQLRDLLSSNRELAAKLQALETQLTGRLAGHDQAIAEIVRTLRQFMNPATPPRRPIGFVELQEKKRL